MSTSEVMTFALTSRLYYGCDYKKCRLVCNNFRFYRGVLSHSQLVRRIHLIPKSIWYMIFYALQMLLRNSNNLDFIVDSFPSKHTKTTKASEQRYFLKKSITDSMHQRINILFSFGIKRQHTPERERKLRYERNKLEIVFSSILSRMPRSNRARTEVGFCLKIIFFILAYMINLSIPLNC